MRVCFNERNHTHRCELHKFWGKCIENLHFNCHFDIHKLMEKKKEWSGTMHTSAKGKLEKKSQNHRIKKNKKQRITENVFSR